MDAKFGLVVEFTLKPGHEEAFDALVRETIGAIQAAEAGTLIYTSHAVGNTPGRRIFYELYRDRAAFDTHEDMPHVRRFLGLREEHLDGIDVKFLTLVDGTGVPTSTRRT